MNLEALRNRAIKIPRGDHFVGTWQAIVWQPNLFTPQTFVVGVVARSSSEQAMQIMDKPGRIECFFKPKGIAREFMALTAMLRAAIARTAPGDDIPLPSPNFRLTEPLFVRGESAQAVADRVFLDTVTAAKALPNDPGPESIGPSTEEARKETAQLLKHLTGTDFERIVREEGQMLSNHFLDVTLAPDHGAGSIVSACYRAPQSILVNLLVAAQDINAYAASTRRDQKAVFIIEPDDDAPLTAKERKTIADLIDNECWKLETSGFRAPRNVTTAAMAQDIRDWAMTLL